MLLYCQAIVACCTFRFPDGCLKNPMMGNRRRKCFKSQGKILAWKMVVHGDISFIVTGEWRKVRAQRKERRKEIGGREIEEEER